MLHLPQVDPEWHLWIPAFAGMAQNKIATSCYFDWRSKTMRIAN
jgi:hypothetical protein